VLGDSLKGKGYQQVLDNERTAADAKWAENREQRAERKEQRAESREERAENKYQRAKRREGGPRQGS
jgi:hypothetical protein